MIQEAQLNEADFRGELFRDHPIDLKGNNDLLVLTKPELIERIHLDFLEAGADIIRQYLFFYFDLQGLPARILRMRS